MAPVVVTDEVCGGEGRSFWASAEGGTDAVVEAAAWESGEAGASVVGDRRPAGVVIDGDDRLVSRVVTLLRRRHGRDCEVPIQLVDTGTFGTMASAVDAASATRVRSMLSADETWLDRQRARLPLLRMTSSAEPAPIWGANFGAGAWFKFAEIVQRGGGQVGNSLRSAARSALDAIGGGEVSRWRVDGARVTIDRKPWGEQVGHLLASSLQSSWLGLQPADGTSPGWIGDTTVSSLPGMLARSRVPGFGGDDAHRFEHLHVNWNAGCVIDGRLVDAGKPHAVELTDATPMTVVA
jgi:hypothetical protein